MNIHNPLSRRRWLKSAGASVAGLVMIRRLPASSPRVVVTPVPLSASPPRPLAVNRRNVQGFDIYPV